MKLSVVTLAYNNNECLGNFLRSLEQYNDIGDDLEIIIVDHNPEKNLALETVKACGHGKCVYVRQDNAEGYGAGNNLGASLAKGEIVAFMNEDIVLTEPVFGKIVQKFVENSNLGWLGGRMLDPDGSNGCSYGYRYEYRFHFHPSFSRQALEYNLFDERTMFLLGCAIFMRRKVFDLIGGFDENIFFCDEESDLTRRVHDLAPGYTIEFHPDIRMIHIGGQSMLLPPFGSMHTIASTVYYAKKYGLEYRNFLLEEYEHQLRQLAEEKKEAPHLVKYRQRSIAELKDMILAEYKLL